MNVLIFVLGILMLIASLTYTVAQQTHQALLLQIEHRQYFRSHEEGELRTQADKAYDAVTVSEGNSGNGGATLSSKFPLRSLFIQSDEQTARETTVRAIFARIIEEAYANKEFYKEMLRALEASSGIGPQGALQQLIQAMIEYAHSEEGSLRSNKDLMKIPFPDLALRNGFCKMLNGRVPVAEGHDSYPPLSSLIDVRRTRGVSIYLAPRAVLRAIYRDESLVNEIFVRRQDIYERLVSDPPGLDKAEGRRELEAVAAGAALLDDEAGLIDYGVSKTRPPRD